MAIGQAPSPNGGYGLQDSDYLLGLAGGVNYTAKNGLVALAGGGKTGATQIPSNVNMVGFETVASANDSAIAPAAIYGSYFFLRNAGAQSLRLYGKGTDLINGAASYDIANGVSAVLFCAKTGHWSAIKSA